MKVTRHSPKLSIITINLNNKEGLEKTIQSVINQTFEDLEYIVIDGASTDGSVAVIQQYVDQIDYWMSEPDKGIYNAMNKGIDRATGEYLLFLNSGDCIFQNETLEKIFRIKFNASIVCGNFIIGDSLNKPPITPDIYYVFRHSLPHQASFIKKRELLDVGSYNENFQVISDWEFYMLALFKNKCSYKYIDIVIARYEKVGVSSDYKYNLKEKRASLNSHFPKLVNLLFFTLEIDHEVQSYRSSRLVKLVKPLMGLREKIKRKFNI